MYTADLICLDLCCAPIRTHLPSVQVISTPLNPLAWEYALHTHPDRAYVHLLLRGMKRGFRIGFDHSAPLRSATSNMHSALEHPDIIETYLEKKRSRGRMLGPFSRADLKSLPSLHINRFRVIPKGHNPGKWRLITDFSYPTGESVNDDIATEPCSLTYTTVEKVVGVAAQLGRGTLSAKIDIESAYRLIPAHPDDRPLQGSGGATCTAGSSRRRVNQGRPAKVMLPITI